MCAPKDVAISSAFLIWDLELCRTFGEHVSISAASVRGRGLRRPKLAPCCGINPRREGQSQRASRPAASAADVHAPAEYAERVQLPRERLGEGDAAERPERPSGQLGQPPPEGRSAAPRGGGRSQATSRAAAALRRDADEGEHRVVRVNGFVTANEVRLVQKQKPCVAQRCHCCCDRQEHQRRPRREGGRKLRYPNASNSPANDTDCD